MADQVEEVKQKSDIVAIVQERVKLNRAGSNFKALCPFHSERTASFMVSPELQIYKCFGCGKGGDVYSFLKEYEGMDFPEALNYLAQRAGVKLEPLKKDKSFLRKERLREVTHIASEYYHYLLNEHEAGKEALTYLAKRGIGKRAIENFKIGYAAADWDSLYRYLVSKKGYLLEDLEAVGLVIKKRRSVYDRFRRRVIFPLRDVRGNVIGFAGRVLPGAEGEGGKYINSPETELYNKSEHVYGLYENRKEIKKEDRVVVVEGELDMISSWLSGIKAVAAVKGTALTRQQLELLRRYTRNLVLALDADAAGQQATKRSIAIADSTGLNSRVALLKGGKDPDEIAQKDTKKWKAIVEKAVSVYDFYLDSSKKRYDLKTGVGKKQASEELIPILASISNSVEQAHYVKKLARTLDVSEVTVLDEIRRHERLKSIDKGQEAVLQEEKEIVERSRGQRLDEYLLAIVLQGGVRLVKPFSEELHELVETVAVGRIFEEMMKRQGRVFEVGKFINSLPKELQEIAQRAYLLDLGKTIEEGKGASEVEQVMKELRRISLRKRMGKLAQDIKEIEEQSQVAKDSDERLEKLSKEFDELSRKLGG